MRSQDLLTGNTEMDLSGHSLDMRLILLNGGICLICWSTQYWLFMQSPFIHTGQQFAVRLPVDYNNIAREVKVRFLLTIFLPQFITA